MRNTETITLTIEVDMNYKDYQILIIFGFDFERNLKETAEQYIKQCARETREQILKRTKHDK